ncbi:hypothetical protein FB446DRAFT_733985 [Lentinula raphanica]|nr:hypothetical protein FB446DRAFT_733985 [Lentinula raphanica]
MLRVLMVKGQLILQFVLLIHEFLLLSHNLILHLVILLFGLLDTFVPRFLHCRKSIGDHQCLRGCPSGIRTRLRKLCNLARPSGGNCR